MPNPWEFDPETPEDVEYLNELDQTDELEELFHEQDWPN